MLKPAMARRLREAAQALDEAHQVRDDALVAAFKAGGGMAEIGREVDLSHVGVAKALERLGVRKRWSSVDEARAEIDRRRELDEQ